MLETTLPGKIQTLLETDVSIKGNPLQGYGLIVILGQVYYSFVLLFCLLGVRRILDCYRSAKSSRNAYVFALVGFFMLVVYMPGPLDLFAQSDISFVRRLILIVSPFIACLAAYGIEHLVSLKDTFRYGPTKSVYLPVLAIILAAPMTFFSLIGTGNAQDCSYFPHTAETDTPYFTNSELTAFSFMNEEADTSLPLYSDYQTQRNTLWMMNFESLNPIQSANISYIQSGYVLIRVGELQRRGSLSFWDEVTSVYRYHIDPADPQSNILVSLSTEDVIYNNGDVQTYIIHKDNAHLQE
jgi:uncharacterized membrane protein